MKIAIRRDEVSQQMDETFALQNLTTVERDALAAVDGMMIFNTTTGDFEGFDTVWGGFGGGGGGGTPGGVNRDVQINDYGAFGVATGKFQFNKTTNALAFGSSNMYANYGTGALANGDIRGGFVDYATVRTNADGSHAHGVAESNVNYHYADIYIGTYGQGGHAGGYVKADPGGNDYYSTKIEARGKGSFIHGYMISQSGGDFSTYGKGSAAFGMLNNTLNNRERVRISGNGSAFIGYKKDGQESSIDFNSHGALLLGNFGSTGAIDSGYTGGNVYNAPGAIQFGNGETNNAHSLSIGGGMRFHQVEDVANISNIRNGDQWIEGGYVYIRSNGVNVKIV